MANNPDEGRSFWMYVAAHSLCFALWILPAVVGVRLAHEFGLQEAAFGVFVAMPILVGSLVRLPLGAAANRYDSRTMMAIVMIAGALAALALSFAQSYWQALVAAAGIGVAGESFAVGVNFVSGQFVDARARRALDWLGSGVAGAALAFIIVDAVHDWRFVFQLAAVILLSGATLFLALAGRASAGKGVPTRHLLLQQFARLQKIQVRRFSLYYFFVFGGFVALVVWLPHYVTEAYGATFKTAALIGSAVALAGGFGRVYGGRLVEDYGARRVLYWTFFAAVAVTFILSYPPASYTISTTGGEVVVRAGVGIVLFGGLVTLLSLFLSFGQSRGLCAHSGVLSQGCRGGWRGCGHDGRARRVSAYRHVCSSR